MATYTVAPFPVSVAFHTPAAPGGGGDDGVITAPRFVLQYRPPTADMLVGVDIATVAWPAPRFRLTIPRPGITLIHLVMSSPDDTEIVSQARPEFFVGVIADNDNDTSVYTLEIRYGNDSGFPALATTTLSRQITLSDGGAIITPTSDLTGTVYWQTRLIDANDDTVVDWSPTQSFTVDSDASMVELPVIWTVVDDTPAAHLWHFSPSGVRGGDTVTIHGQGFTNTAAVRFGGDVLPVRSRTLVSATSENTTSARTIDGATVTCEHWEIVVTAPETDGVGDVITVEI